MMKMFQEKFVTPEQKKLAEFVNQKGGKEAIRNEQVMKELVAKEASISAPVGNERHKSTKKFDLVEIQREIQSDPTDEIEKNKESFNSKFHFLMKQIQMDVDHSVKQQGDRIFSAVTGGPYERIVDPVRILVGSRSFANFSFRSSVKSGRTW